MASSFIANAHQVNFESVLAIPDNEGMLNMFRTLEASGVRGFFGFQSVLYEHEMEQFFDTALVQDGDITGAVSGKFFSISQSRFAEVFDLPTEGLVDFSEVPKNLVYDSRSIFSKSGEPVSTYGKKKLMKYEYRMLNDILAKAITVKADLFDAVTNERFLMMTSIQFCREEFVALFDPAAGLGDQLATESMTYSLKIISCDQLLMVRRRRFDKLKRSVLIVTLVTATGSKSDISLTSSLGY
ncbi:CMP-N-acetylneuraminate-beta-galactosamide-alpha-2, 3-sialyltransferase 2 [Dorcoceras hygrometricum]|uniref:CMP-N-acetylneuraminate-beta-galactosamide-alpha-2, 3-sialyltransferase 2 n=1 Tax=Dorcoceras hygrometricum TaxID=472368 RepID=A0A2Z7BIL3_9LAMI|nr:CMP-N-acetylneuraminate-beta-galactosamide-alpha-2, 3-sialyltransferase 2 [Dorcoceras hygrometricum]